MIRSLLRTLVASRNTRAESSYYIYDRAHRRNAHGTEKETRYLALFNIVLGAASQAKPDVESDCWSSAFGLTLSKIATMMPTD